jgi:hypothetical protein
MTTKFSMIRDINGYNGFGLIPSNTVYSTTLAQNVAQNFTVSNLTAFGGLQSTNFTQVLMIFSFDPGSSVYVAYNNTALVPTSSFLPTGAELNPAAWLVENNDMVSFITTDSSVGMTMKLYQI